jgi:uncharacterized membrane protein
MKRNTLVLIICLFSSFLYSQNVREHFIIPEKVEQKITKSIKKDILDSNSFVYAEVKNIKDFIELSIYKFPIDKDTNSAFVKVFKRASSFILIDNKTILIKPQMEYGKVHFTLVTTPVLRIRYKISKNKVRIIYFYKVK